MNTCVIIIIPFSLTSYVLHGMKVITADELMDDGEYEEILEDMKDEGGKFGIHTSLYIGVYIFKMCISSW